MLALARKYRPRRFAEVAVQTHVAETLKGAIARDRVAHGYLLCGPRGTGKTTLARVLAMALNCERRGEAALLGEPCGDCPSCRRIWGGSTSLDVVEIDAASNRGVEDARSLRERAMYAPSGDDGYKVYIVDEAHMLTKEAWNTLLKVLEEPPPRVVFVFATTEPQKIAQAAAPVLSRLQRFDLKRIGPGEIRERLRAVLESEGIAAEEDALALIARAADGGLRDALSLTDQVLSLGEEGAVTTDRVRTALGLMPDEEYFALFDHVTERQAAAIFPALQRLADEGVDFALVLGGLGDLLRALLAMTLGGAPADLPERQRQSLAERVGRLPAGDLLRMLHALLELEPLFRRSGQQQLLLETLLVRFALLDRTIDLEEVLRGVASAPATEGPAPRRAAHPPPVAAMAAPPAPPAAPPPPTPRPASQRVAETAAAAQQRATPEASPRRAERPAPAVAPPALDAVRARWGDVAEAVRRAGRGMVAQAVQQATPLEVSALGVLTIGYQPGDDITGQALERARADVLAAVQGCCEGVTGVALRVVGAPAPADGPARRLTADEVQRQRLEQLAARDPVLDAAVRALDLELRG